ncbi:MAG: hypothetical protein ACRDST_01270 [Pseudonocardiaceae bacterium]
MSDTVSFAELDGQHVELLPARTVLSMFSPQGGDGVIPKDLDLFSQLTKALGLDSDSTGSSSTDGAAGTSDK